MAGDWFNGNGGKTQVDVAALMDGMGWQGVRELVEAGALVSLGLTSDGGALGFTVTVDGEWRREYFREQDELLAHIAEAIPVVEAARNAGDRPSSGSRPRTRGRRTR